jgi:hypothetical protein
MLRFTLADGRVVDYAGVSPLELWAAYNFVQPTKTLLDALAPHTLAGNAAGLVGMSSIDHETGEWSFGIHPAISQSPLALAAMRLDMFIAAIRAGREQSYLRAVDYMRDVPLGACPSNRSLKLTCVGGAGIKLHGEDLS